MADEAKIRRLRKTGDHHRKMSRALRTAGKVEESRKANQAAVRCYDRADELEDQHPA